MYTVIHPFADVEDALHVYDKGDVYPREGRSPSPERIEELRTSNNKAGIPLIGEEKKAKKEVPLKKPAPKKAPSEKPATRKPTQNKE